MAIALDTSTNSTSIAGASSKSWSHTCSGSDRILIVGFGGRDTVAADMVVSSITYNGVALTSIRSDAVTVDTSFRTELWYLIAPATGANTIAVTFAGTVDQGACTAVSLTGVSQDPLDVIDAHNGATGVSSSSPDSEIVAVTTVRANSWLTDIIYSRSDTATCNASQTQLQNLVVGANDAVASSYKATTSAQSYNMSWSSSAGDPIEDYAISAVSIAPVYDRVLAWVKA